jgi:hypothetical protein
MIFMTASIPGAPFRAGVDFASKPNTQGGACQRPGRSVVVGVWRCQAAPWRTYVMLRTKILERNAYLGAVTPTPLFPNPAEDFLDIVEGLCRAISEQENCPRMPRAFWAPFAALLIARLRRAAHRFSSIVARLRAGTLPRPRPRQRTPSPDGGAEPRSARPREPDPFPRGYAWLCDLVPYSAKAYGYVLGQLTRDPGMRELLAAAPGLWRIMRPLLIMTAGDRGLMRPWRRARAPRRETAAARSPRAARPPHPLRPPNPENVITPDMPHHPSQVLARLPGYRPRGSRKIA